MKNKSESFTVKLDDKEVCLHVRRPTPEEVDKANMTYNSTFRKALAAGALFKSKIESYMREQQLWDDNKAEMVLNITSRLVMGQKKLEKGGIKLSEAKKIALDIKRAREEWRDLIAEKIILENNTAEGQAENAKFNHLVSMCTVYNDTGKPFYADLSAYLNDESQVGFKAATALSNLMHDTEESEKDLPENKFLIKHKMVDSKLRLINKDGKLIDETGRLINENGEWINENGELVDKDNNLLPDNSPQPFLDEEGNPVE